MVDFKLPPQPKKWTLAANVAQRKLPQPGVYPARLAEVGLHDKGDTLWFGVGYEFTGDLAGETPPERDFGAIAAEEGSAHEKRLAEGARLLYRTAAAAGVTLPDDLDPYDLPDLLEGKEVQIKIIHKTIDGVPAMIVRRAMPLAAA